MRKIRDVLRLRAGGMSKRKIAASLSIGVTAANTSPQRSRRSSAASGGKDYIETVWGRGYVLRQPTDEEPAKISA